MNAQAGKLGFKGRLVRLLLTPEIGILIPLIILMAYTALKNPAFLSVGNFAVILRYSTFMGIICIGQAVVLMTGEVDISLGANLCFSGIIFGTCSKVLGMPPLAAILFGIAAGGAVGAINGYLVAGFGLVNFIATLSTQYLCLGLATAISDGAVIAPLASGYLKFAQMRPLRLSWPFFIFLALFLIMELVIRYTKLGRMIQAVGGNIDAAYSAGVNVRKVKWLVYILAGLFAGLAGVLMSIDQASSSPTSGMGLEFRTVAACAVGGISMLGGAGTILGAGIGIMMIYVLQNSLQSLQVQSNWQMIIIGAVLILSVLFDLLKKKLVAADSIN